MKTSTPTGSLERFIRTFVHVAIASAAAYPTLLAALPISATVDAKVIGLVGAIVLVVTAVHNALESKGVIPAMLRYVPPAMPQPTDVAAVAGGVSDAMAAGSAGIPLDPTHASPGVGP